LISIASPVSDLIVSRKNNLTHYGEAMPLFFRTSNHRFCGGGIKEGPFDPEHFDPKEIKFEDFKLRFKECFD
jgi:hypothetical protein